MERPGRDSARDIRELSRGPRTETATWTWPSPCSIPFAEVCIQELPADDRAVVLLRDVEGLSRQEIAEALGLTVANVKARVHRARLFLRKRLDAGLSIPRVHSVPRPRARLLVSRDRSREIRDRESDHQSKQRFSSGPSLALFEVLESTR